MSSSTGTVDPLMFGGHPAERMELAEIVADALSDERWRDNPTAGVDLGWSGIGVSESAGGSGGSLADLAVVIEAVGATTAATMAPCAALVAGLLTPADGTTAEIIDSLVGGASIAIGLTRGENGALALGSAAAAHVLMSGADGRSILLPSDTQGMQLDSVPSFDPSRRYARVTFDGPWFAYAPRLRADDWLVRLGLLCALDSAGAARTALARTLAYARDRQQFGRAIGSFQAYKHRCASMYIELKLAQSLAFRAASELDQGRWELAHAAALASTAAATFVCGEAVQLHGGIGFTWEAGLHVLLKRARANEIIADARPGGGAALRLVSASAIRA